jgi:hypothetical protein
MLRVGRTDVVRENVQNALPGSRNLLVERCELTHLLSTLWLTDWGDFGLSGALEIALRVVIPQAPQPSLQIPQRGAMSWLTSQKWLH